MAGKSTVITSKEFFNGVKILTCVFTADDTTHLFTDAVIPSESGKKLHSIVVLNGATGMTSTSDLSIVDSLLGSTNLVATNGANVGGNNVLTRLVPDSTYDPAIVMGTLTVKPDATGSVNIVDSAVVTVHLVFMSSF